MMMVVCRWMQQHPAAAAEGGAAGGAMMTVSLYHATPFSDERGARASSSENNAA